MTQFTQFALCFAFRVAKQHLSCVSVSTSNNSLQFHTVFYTTTHYVGTGYIAELVASPTLVTVQ